MSNSFKKIIPEEKASDELKKKVMESAASTKLMMDMAELYSTKYVESFADLFRTRPKPKQENGPKSQNDNTNDKPSTDQ
jgi:hypothetical protein